MAKVKDKNTVFDSNEKIIAGTDNDGELSFDTTDVKISTFSGIDINISPGSGTAKLVIDAMNFPSTDGAADQIMTTNGIGQMYWATYSGIAPMPPSPPTPGDRGIFGGDAGPSDVIQYITITSVGNSTDFGNLTQARSQLSACSNASNERGIFGGGHNVVGVDTIDYVTINSVGNAVDFGNLGKGLFGLAGASNATNERGLFSGGYISKDINYITISTTANSSIFGHLAGNNEFLSSTSNGINNRAIFGGGYTTGYTAVIEYVAINSPGDASSFGNLTDGRWKLAATSNGTNERGVFAGGHDGSTYLNIIDYVTINSASSATDFGDLTTGRRSLASCSNATDDRGVFAGGELTSSTRTNIIDYITISSTANAVDFGDLLSTDWTLAGTANA